MPAIDVHGLAKTFPGRGRVRRRRPIEAVRDITFQVEAGERLAYIGPNGAGKSTSIKMLTGILHPSGGRATVLGLVPWRERKALARRIGTLFGQRSQLWPALTPRQTYGLLARIYDLDPSDGRRRADELGELLDARSLLDRPVRTLSLGERMRCELGATMLHRPEVLFLDEPTIGLDLVAKARFRDLLLRLNDELGTTVLLTSHDTADIEHVAERVIVINHGALIYDDSVRRLRSELLRTKLIEVRFDEDPGALELDGVEELHRAGRTLELRVDTTRRDIRSVLDELLDGPAVADISVLDPPLEDVIGRIYATPRT